MLKKQTNIVIFIHHVNILRMEDGRTLLQWTDAETESEELCCSSQDIACITHRPGPWFRHWVVVCVPLLCLPVDLSVAPTEGSFHLCHGEGAHRWAARCPFIPARTSKGNTPYFFCHVDRFSLTLASISLQRVTQSILLAVVSLENSCRAGTWIISILKIFIVLVH